MVVIGVDVGLTGAMSGIDSRGTCDIRDMPTRRLSEKDTRMCGRGIKANLLAMVPTGETCMVVCEDVWVRVAGNGDRFNNSMSSQTKLVRGRGVLEGVCDAMGIECTFVTPQTWKRFFDLLRKDKADTDLMLKERARQMAIRLYPAAAGSLSRKKDHNRAESVLIAHWASRCLL